LLELRFVSRRYLRGKLWELTEIDAPTIFRIAGFNTEKSQWISGLNNIFYMVIPHLHLLNTSLTVLVLHSHMCLHPRPHRQTLDTILGIRRPRPRHVPRRGVFQTGNQQLRALKSLTIRRRRRIHDLHLHIHIRRHMAHSPLALPS